MAPLMHRPCIAPGQRRNTLVLVDSATPDMLRLPKDEEAAPHLRESALTPARST